MLRAEAGERVQSLAHAAAQSLIIIREQRETALIDAAAEVNKTEDIDTVLFYIHETQR